MKILEVVEKLKRRKAKSEADKLNPRQAKDQYPFSMNHNANPPLAIMATPADKPSIPSIKLKALIKATIKNIENSTLMMYGNS